MYDRNYNWPCHQYAVALSSYYLHQICRNVCIWYNHGCPCYMTYYYEHCLLTQWDMQLLETSDDITALPRKSPSARDMNFLCCPNIRHHTHHKYVSIYYICIHVQPFVGRESVSWASFYHLRSTSYRGTRNSHQHLVPTFRSCLLSILVPLQQCGSGGGTLGNNCNEWTKYMAQ